jgi:hypothetical protein
MTCTKMFATAVIKAIKHISRQFDMLAGLYGVTVSFGVKLGVVKSTACSLRRSAIQETRMKYFTAHFNASYTRGSCISSILGAFIGKGYEIITR